MSLSFQGTYCLTPGKYDSVSLSAEFDPFEISDLVQKKDVRLRATRDDRADAASGRGSVPGSASWSAVEGDGRLRVTALPSCMELSETQKRQNLAIHGIWMYGMLCYVWLMMLMLRK